MLSGGSFASWSATRLATIVTVHSSLKPKSAVGSSVKVVGPPLTEAVCEPLLAQEIVYQLPDTLTASLNVTLTFELSGTPVAPFAGFVLLTLGAVSAGAATVRV